jgi:hypothetical protein
MKMLMQSSVGDLKITGATINGSKFRQLVLEGYKFIGYVWGLNVGVSGLDIISKDKQVIIDKQNAIIKFEQEEL